jgi:hypothetical protein
MNPDINEESEWMSMDGYDDCIIGIVEQFGRPPILCYDRSLIIKKLMSDGSSLEEAEEFFEFNQIGAYVGDSTPCFFTHISPEDCVSLGIIE